MVWTGREMVIWGGTYADTHDRSDGAAYNPETNRWRKLARSPLSARSGPSAVWTGREMIIWGGAASSGKRVFGDGAAYNPTTNRWRRLPRSPLSARSGAVAVWTGPSAMFLGGSGVREDPWRSRSDGAVYDPVENSWQRIAPPRSARRSFAWRTAIQAGPARLLALTSWVVTHRTAHGSSTRGGADLFSFDETRNRWSLEPSPKDGGVADPYEAVWAGGFAIVRGSPINCGMCSHPVADGVTSIYTPRSGTWRRTAPDPLRTDHVASVWTGRGLFSFNGGTSIQGGGIDIAPGDASTYDPGTDTWERLPRSPGGCTNPSTPIWTGRSILIYCPGSVATTRQPAGLILTPQ